MPTKTPHYYVTTEGLKAGLVNSELLLTLKGILLERAHPQTVKAFERRGLIAKDQRDGERADHNLLILSGAVDRIRHIVMPNGQPPTTPASTAAVPHAGRQPVKYLPQEAPKPALPPTVQQVYDAFKKTGAASVPELMAADKAIKALNPGTLRWAIQQLRQKRLLETVTEAHDLAVAS